MREFGVFGRLRDLGFIVGASIRMVLPPLYSFNRLERYYKRRLARRPGLLIARNALVQLYLDHGRLEEARRELAEALRADDPPFRTRALAADVAFRLRDYTAVIHHLERVKERTESSPFLTAMLGLSYTYAGRYEEAVAALSRATRAAEARPITEAGRKRVEPQTLYEALAFSCLNVQRWASALEAYRRAVALDRLPRESRDNIATGCATVANAFLKNADFQDAEDALRTGISAGPRPQIAEDLRAALDRVVEERRRLNFQQN